MVRMTRDICVKAIYGGLFLGGGGGGQLCDGQAILEELFSCTDSITLLDAGELDDSDILVTASLVGAPSAKERFVNSNSWNTAYENFKRNYHGPISGFITNENGAISTTNGWILSALTGIPVVDIPCNGRAQPTAIMGSMGLHQIPSYRTIQSACGGQGERYMEMMASGTVQTTSALVRQGAVQSGGFMAVLRNPIQAHYAKHYGAAGGIAQAIAIGERIVHHIGDGERVLRELTSFPMVQAVCRGTVSHMDMITEGGFDRGVIYLQTDSGDGELTFWNEYITFEHKNQRIATFPDLIATIDLKTGLPLTTAVMQTGQEVAIITVPMAGLKLGAGMFNRELIQKAGDMVGKAV